MHERVADTGIQRLPGVREPEDSAVPPLRRLSEASAPMFLSLPSQTLLALHSLAAGMALAAYPRA